MLQKKKIKNRVLAWSVAPCFNDGKKLREGAAIAAELGTMYRVDKHPFDELALVETIRLYAQHGGNHFKAVIFFLL